MIAHSPNYGCRFLLKYLRTLAPPIDKNSKFIQVKGEFHRSNNANQALQIVITDSYRLIPMALSEFGECLNLDVSKEIMPCKLFIEDNLLHECVPITEAIEAIKKSIEHEYYNSEKQENELNWRSHN